MQRFRSSGALFTSASLVFFVCACASGDETRSSSSDVSETSGSGAQSASAGGTSNPTAGGTDPNTGGSDGVGGGGGSNGAGGEVGVGGAGGGAGGAGGDDSLDPLVFCANNLDLHAWQPAIQVDATGNIDFTYQTLGFWNLHIGSLAPAGVFTTGLIDDGDNPNSPVPTALGDTNALAVDAAGTMHASYFDGGASDLKYASRPQGGIWSKEVVDGVGEQIGSPSSIVVDSAGIVHIAYREVVGKAMKYAFGNSGAWTIEVVEAGDTDGDGLALALDSTGAPHIVYTRYSTVDLIVASRSSSGVWSTETVVSVGDTGYSPHMTIDANDAFHIAFFDISQGSTRYVSRPSGGVWAQEDIDLAGPVGWYPKIAVDAQHVPSVVYYDPSGGGKLKFARRSPMGNWTTQVLPLAQAMPHSTIAIDGQGNPHIIGRESNLNRLHYISPLACP